MRAKMYAIANLRYLQHCEMCDTRRYGDYGVEHIEYVVVNISETEQYFLAMGADNGSEPFHLIPVKEFQLHLPSLLQSACGIPFFHP
jgi:hypothetical protein